MDEDLDYTIELLHAELEAHRQRFARAEQRIAALERAGSRLTRANRARATKLLAALTGAIGSKEFLVAEVLPLPAVRLVLPGWTGRSGSARLGRLLRQVTGVDIGGLTVERLGTEASAAIWRVVGVLKTPVLNTGVSGEPEVHRSRTSGTPPVRRRRRVGSRS